MRGDLSALCVLIAIQSDIRASLDTVCLLEALHKTNVGYPRIERSQQSCLTVSCVVFVHATHADTHTVTHTHAHAISPRECSPEGDHTQRRIFHIPTRFSMSISDAEFVQHI
jgi:hypothetical protein